MDETTINAAIARATKLRPHYVHITSQLFPIKLTGNVGITGDRFMRLYHDPEVIGPWELDWAASRVLVVVEHYVRKHSLRQKGREQVTWDVATEIAITDALAEERLRFPPDTLFPEKFGLSDGQTAEEYAAQLLGMCRRRRMQISDQLESIAGQAIPQFGSAGGEDWKNFEIPEDADVPTIDYLVALMRAREHDLQDSAPPGVGAGSEVRDDYERRDSVIDWRVHLRGLLGSAISTNAGMSDYSFLMPDPDIGLHHGMIMPGMVGMRSNIAVVVDTSGSMGKGRLGQAVAEVGGILKTLDGEYGIQVYTCDSVVQSARTVHHLQQMSVTGGGGTDIGVGIKAALAGFPTPDIVIVITDGDTPWPKRAPKVPVLVVLVSEREVPNWVWKTIHVALTA